MKINQRGAVEMLLNYQHEEFEYQIFSDCLPRTGDVVKIYAPEDDLNEHFKVESCKIVICPYGTESTKYSASIKLTQTTPKD
jgi:ribosomal protein S4E